MHGPGRPAPRRLPPRRRRGLEAAARQELIQRGLRPTRVFDRTYFHSVYVRMPDGLLLEFATDGPGFTVDEPGRSARRDAQAPGLARGGAGVARVAAPPI